MIASIFSVVSCDNNSRKSGLLTLNGFTMGTSYTVKINEPRSKFDPLQIKKSIDTLLDDLNAKMSTYLPDSELSRINQSRSTEWLNISDDLYEVIKQAVNIYNLSEGAFDITIGPLVNLWGFGPDKKPASVPDDRQIQILLNTMGTNKIHLNDFPKAIKKEDIDVYIDLSGIAKGYAVDRIADLLQYQFSINNFMIEIGGEIRAKGINPDKQSWRIGIEKPVGQQRSVERIINLDNTGMATSGDYRNYFVDNGIHYSHFIDPRTGKPVTHPLVSVTVLHSESMIADAWATALQVLGHEKGINLVNKFNLPVFFIIKTHDGYDEVMSDSFRQYNDRTRN
jgi:thiamine biosynthesis lipoprotein